MAFKKSSDNYPLSIPALIGALLILSSCAEQTIKPSAGDADSNKATTSENAEVAVKAPEEPPKKPAQEETKGTAKEETKPSQQAVTPPAADADSKETKPIEIDVPGITQRSDAVVSLCAEVGGKLSSVSEAECLKQQLMASALSAQVRALTYKDYPPLKGQAPMGRILVIGGIHGDEYSSVSVVFKWMAILNQHHSGLFHWRFLPVSNPDGLLQKKSQRQNSHGVDLNRNFPSEDWLQNAHRYWQEKTYSNPRRNPGPKAASEPETQWLVAQIKEFKPDIIVSMHAPYHLVDYDGPPTAPDKLGGLYLRRLGVYPGSLGNYAGIDLKIPVVTVELKSAGIMPPNSEIQAMWRDLISWLRKQLSQ